MLDQPLRRDPPHCIIRIMNSFSATKSEGEGSFGHDGAGGRLAFAHPESGVAAAYVANTMSSGFGGPDPRWAWIAELRKAIAA